MLSKLASLSLSSLRKLDDEVNKFYDRKHELYEAVLLTRCYKVLKKSKTVFLRYIGYRNFINDLIKHVSLLILVHVRLLFCPNC